jgi:hypothetical protein
MRVVFLSVVDFLKAGIDLRRPRRSKRFSIGARATSVTSTKMLTLLILAGSFATVRLGLTGWRRSRA